MDLKKFIKNVVYQLITIIIAMLILAFIMAPMLRDNIEEQDSQLDRIERKLDSLIIMQKMEMGIYEQKGNE